MSETNADIYARKFSFRSFEGTRRGRAYRVCIVAWDWWIHQWKRSRTTKILTVVLLFFLILTNMLLFTFIDMKRQTSPNLTNKDILEGVLLQLVRGVVSFQTEFYAIGEGSESIMMTFGGLSIFIILFMVLIGSGLISDDISNNNTEIYFSKLERYEYILGKFGAFVISGNILITIPFILEFFLLFIGIGGIDFIAALPILLNVIIMSELFILTFASIILAFSSLTDKRLYAGVMAYMYFFTTNMIIPSLAFTTEGEVGLVILFDILTVLLIASYLVVGKTELLYVFGHEFHELDLSSGHGIESWIILGALGVYILIGLVIVAIKIYWTNRK